MRFRSFRHNYHDSHVSGFKLGPRREFTLEVALDPVWNKEASAAAVRFGGIANYDEVCSYFRAFSPSTRAGSYFAEVVGLEYVGEGSNWVVVDLMDHPSITVQAQHITEL